MTAPGPASPRRLTFSRRSRLTHAAQFDAVYAAKLKKPRGALVFFAKPNGLAFPRLGLSVGRRVGIAARRARVKRMLREAFRHEQHAFPRSGGGSYDLVASARADPELGLTDLRAAMLEAMIALDLESRKRSRRQGERT